MMRLAFLFVLAILLPVATIAEGLDLDAIVQDQELSGFNCNPTGGPATYEFSAMVSNPYESAMSVNISYYDFDTGGMVDSGRICVVPPQSALQSCRVRMPVRLGGIGNGTTTLIATLTGSFLNSRTETPSRSFNLTITHQPTSSEQSVLDIITSSETQLANRRITLASACDGNACCGMRSSLSSFDTVSYLLSSARGMVGRCEFSQALSETSTASALLRQAQSSYDEAMPACTAALEMHRQARLNISSANSTLFSRAACGVPVDESRAELSRSARLLGESEPLFSSDSYDEASAMLRQALDAVNSSIGKSQDCPPAGFEPPMVQTPGSQPTLPPQPQSDMLSKVVGALGYIVIAAVVIVVAAALYISFGKKYLGGGSESAPPREDFGMPPAPPSKGEGSIGIDHSKIDREFEDWLKQSETKPSEKPSLHRPKKK